MPADVSAYVPLANLTLSATAASVTFSSISSAYRDLVLVINCSTTAGGAVTITINGDATVGNYLNARMNGSGSAATSGSGGGLFVTSSASNDRFIQLDFLDYSLTNKHKTFLVKHSAPSTWAEGRIQRWTNTSAITSILLGASGTTFTVGSSFALYGVSA